MFVGDRVSVIIICSTIASPPVIIIIYGSRFEGERGIIIALLPLFLS